MAVVLPASGGVGASVEAWPDAFVVAAPDVDSAPAVARVDAVRVWAGALGDNALVEVETAWCELRDDNVWWTCGAPPGPVEGLEEGRARTVAWASDRVGDAAPVDARPLFAALAPAADPLGAEPRAWALAHGAWDSFVATAAWSPVPVPTSIHFEPVQVANPVGEPPTALATPAMPAVGSVGLQLHAASQALAGDAAERDASLALPEEGARARAGPADPADDAAVRGAVPDAGDSLAPSTPQPQVAGPTVSSASSGAVANLSFRPAEAAAGLGLGASLLAVPVWALYRRVVAARALEQPQRKRVYDSVLAAPGSTPADITAVTGLHYTTALHHLRILQGLGFIELKRLGGQLRCFENHGRYGATQARALAAARTATVRDLLAMVVAKPDITPADAARGLGVTRATVKHHVDRLAEWGVLQVEAEGRNLHLRAAPGVAEALAAAPAA